MSAGDAVVEVEKRPSRIYRMRKEQIYRPPKEAWAPVGVLPPKKKKAAPTGVLAPPKKVELPPAAGKEAEKSPSRIYRMGKEQIDDILSWDLPATNYKPVFVNEESYSDEQREGYRRLVLEGTYVKNRLLYKRRELQDYVKNQLALHGYVDIDENMHYPDLR